MLALILAAAAPAAAVPPRSLPYAVAAALDDPAVQRVAALQVTVLAGVVLDAPAGPLAALAGPGGRPRPDATLRDIVHIRDPDTERHLYEGSRRAIATAGRLAAESLAGVAEAKRAADRLRATLAPLVAALGR